MSLVETVGEVVEDENKQEIVEDKHEKSKQELINTFKDTKCRFWKKCAGYSNMDYFCNFTYGRHGVDLTTSCYRERKI